MLTGLRRYILKWLRISEEIEYYESVAYKQARQYVDGRFMEVDNKLRFNNEWLEMQVKKMENQLKKHTKSMANYKRKIDRIVEEVDIHDHQQFF